MTVAGLACDHCGTELPANSEFCNECGAAVSAAAEPAEYKQVTVLFADVVHSMDIAVAVGAERLREIMTELVNRAGRVVHRFGGTVDRFTGDGIMAVFGAPVALEDHAFRACLAALGIQEEAARLAVEIQRHDDVDLRLRVGLNSGQVIVGEIGSSALGYTAIGEQVGMAQRMESVAPPGGVMLSVSTARLVEDVAVLAEPEMVRIKGANDPVAAYRLITTTAQHQHSRRKDPTLVGRTWELNTIAAILDEAVDGGGCVISVLGPPGIGKSRIVRESAALASNHGAEVFTTYCPRPLSAIPSTQVSTRLARIRHVHETKPFATWIETTGKCGTEASAFATKLETRHLAWCTNSRLDGNHCYARLLPQTRRRAPQRSRHPVSARTVAGDPTVSLGGRRRQR